MFYFGWMAIGFMAIAGLATVTHWYNRVWYESNLLNIRKTSYTIMALIYFGMILAGHILLNDWVQAVQFASIAIFIDLAILETPSIQKIGNTEFKKNDQIIEKTIRDNERIILSSFQKTAQFTAVVQYSQHHLTELTDEQKDQLPEWDLYSSMLKEYLRYYTDTFGLRISTTSIQFDSDLEIRMNKIRNSLSQIERSNSILIPEENKEEMSKELAEAAVYVVEEGNTICVPFFGTSNSFIITIQAAESGAILNGMDANNIVNLVQIFDWFIDG
ncbi:Toxin SpoIISA, type II toxin-antitoxin system [Paenibacillus sp. OK060]|uniref:type II toxin-antitoxin system SpoIISA family toxin n=1 Tax=Paenibacillus sp. OK060 TaxID=1881034 RepID=UPI0008822641|nr:type II toxin-antitoxin system SpoIISA family toxin [Paenibacillus sp. OK060]SDM17014.1 Toxin SpoIISA, type II toxin-antitoxin system [Paenibacillus sp. OK060]